MENRLKSFEQKSRKLKEGNKKLKKENDFLKSHLKHYQEDSEAREKELEHLLKVSKDVENDKGELQVKITELEREVTTLRRQVAEAKALSNDSEEVVSPGDKAKSEMATREVRARPCDCKTTTTKVKFKAAKKKISVGRHHTLLNHSIKVMSHIENLSKDGWEDVSEGR